MKPVNRKDESFAPDSHGVIYFLVGDRSSGIYGYTWRIWWGRTSFYLKPTSANFAEMKVSLHGDDPKIQNPMMKFDIDRGATPGVEERGGLFRQFVNLPLRFGGVPTDDPNATLVMRIRNTWDLFQPGAESVPFRKRPKPRDVGLIAGAPPTGYAMDLDIYVASNAPYWPHEATAKMNRAALGPLKSAAGQFLTAVVVKRATALTPTPEEVMQPSQPGGTRRRGLGFRADADGLLWVVEQMVRTG